VSIPTRPPAERWAQPPSEDIINRAYQILQNKVEHVEYLIGYEGNAFTFTGNAKNDLLSITSVHPLREYAVEILLSRANSNWDIVHQLIKNNQITESTYGGYKFYVRKFNKKII